MPFELARHTMVARQIAPMGVTDPHLLTLLRQLPREHFVSPQYAALAYSDGPIPLRGGQVLWAPALIGQGLQALAIQPTDVVLEIGAGTGYVTTLLSHCARQVFSIESDWALLEIAKKNVQHRGKPSVILHAMEGQMGWPAHAPYDVIWVGGACPTFPTHLVDQLAIGGRLLCVVGTAPAMHLGIYVKTSASEGKFDTLCETVVPYLPGSFTEPSSDLWA